MKNLLFSFFLLISYLPCLGQSNYGVNVKAFNNAYMSLKKNPSSVPLQKAFLDQFPSTWDAFYATYRFSNHPNFDDTMYRTANAHIEMLDKLNGIDRPTYYAKLINILVGGFWDADAPSLLKSIVEKALDKDSEGFFKMISSNSAARQMLFWQFMWENPIKSSTLATRYNRLKQTMSARYPKEVKTMSIAYDYFGGEIPVRLNDNNVY